MRRLLVVDSRPMPYYDTIEEDMVRAKQIIDEGKLTAADLEGITAPAIISMSGGTIYGNDIYAAYKLLESFVAEIERLHTQARCSHKFIDSTHCLKCGWQPPPRSQD